MTDQRSPDYGALLRQALVAIQDLEARLAASRNARNEPIAIIGMACRFPGGADTPEGFWDLLMEGRDAVTEVPPERWDVDAVYDPDPDAAGKSYTRWGSFLAGVDLFDADLFGISPREAASLDPQQRLLLELAWEALERAGIAPTSLTGTAGSVHIGMCSNDYVQLMNQTPGFVGDAYTASGTSHAMASGRLSYVFGLHGASAAVDTACSSSHVALHAAVQGLRNRETDIALAGAANLTLVAAGSVMTSRARMMSFTGRCHTFDAAADGYVRGEACGMLILKRLADAQRDGDKILAVLRGSAINQDGRSSGLTAPNGRAQEMVLRAALDNAGLTPLDISYVEAHGTGTSLGDPIEVKALGEVLGDKARPRPLLIASAKTNIGHTEGAAGVVGIIKTVLALRHRQIPPHLHLTQPNPMIPWDRYAIEVPTRVTPWPSPDGKPRRAGVSSFGFSGTNGHVILEEAPEPTVAAPDARPQLFVLSAQTAAGLKDLAGRWATYLERADVASLSLLAQAVAYGRAHLNERLAVVASDAAVLRERLAAFVAADPAVPIAHARTAGNVVPETVFMFTGQGAQYRGMALGLYTEEPVFRSALDRCAAIADQYLEVPLLTVLAGEGAAAGLIDDTAYAQPALFAVEYALAQLWKHWGVEPTAVMGHSVGEYVAACLAGVFSLEDGLKLISARGRLMSRLPRDGSMVAVFAGESTVRAALRGAEGEIAIAAVNGPASVVISGRTSTLEPIIADLAARGVESQRLVVSHAFHSPLMEPILDEFEAVAATIRFSAPAIELLSNVTGRLAGEEVTTTRYWRTHLREAVRFSDAVTALLQDGYRLFLEVGPTPVLSGMAQRCSGADAATWVTSLRRGRDDRSSLLESLGQLHVRGVRVRWSSVVGKRDLSSMPIDLPTYAFQRRRFWLEVGPATEAAVQLNALATGHPLLGAKLASPVDIFESRIGLQEHPWLGDHRMFDVKLFPAAGFMEMALAAAAEVAGTPEVALLDITLREILMLPDEGSVVLQVLVGSEEDGEGAARRSIRIFSRPDDLGPLHGWREHFSAQFRVEAPVAGSPFQPPAPIEGGEAFETHRYYLRLAENGAQYGPKFQALSQITIADRQASGWLQLPDALAAQRQRLFMHPVLLDSTLQLLGGATPGIRDTSVKADVYLPAGFGRLRIMRREAAAGFCHVQIEPFVQGADSLRGAMRMVDAQGEVIAELQGILLRRITRGSLQRAVTKAATGRNKAPWLFETAWRESPLADPPAPPARGRWLVVADAAGMGAAFADRLVRGGVEVTQVPAGDLAAARRALSDGSGTVTAIVSFAALDHACRGERALGAGSRSGPHDDLEGVEAAQRDLLSAILDLAQAATEGAASSPRLWLVTRGAQPTGRNAPDLAQAALIGLGNVIAAELPQLRCVRVDLDPVIREGEADLLFATLSQGDAEDRIALRGGQRLAARLVPGQLEPETLDMRRLEISQRGQLDNLELRRVSRALPGAGEVEIRVLATGLNFRDVLNTLGMYPGDPGPLGGECAGIVTAVGEGVTHLAVGDEVVSFTDRCFATWVTAPASVTVRKPPGLSFAEAATVPVAFMTAQYGLHDLARIRKGDRVLIHAATGGLGMAAVQIARLAGAEIFGTAGSPAKRDLARRLGVHHVSDSRSLSFVEDVRAQTGGEGVDIVLNSLAGDFIPASLGLLRPGGRFIEVGKTGIWDRARVAEIYAGVDYHALYLGEVAAKDATLARSLLERIFAQMVDGDLQPLPQITYPLEQAQDAFRFMAQGLHTGKIVLTQHHRPVIDAHATYLITGGLGGIGLTCARWLADLGARHLVLTGRRIASGAAQEAVAELQAQGVEVVVATADVGDRAQLAQVLADIDSAMPPLRGILPAAGSLDDGMLREQTWARFERVLGPKVRGTWNLHELTQSRQLDFFVLFSSAAALLGSPGQGNYASANAFMDAFAHARSLTGRPTVSINWNSWSEVGMAAGLSEQHHRRWAALGLALIDPAWGMQMLQDVLQRSGAPQVAAIPLTGTGSAESPSGPFFAELAQRPTAEGTAPERRPADNILARLAPLAGAERHVLLVEYLGQLVIRVLALSSTQQPDTHRSLMDMGMDSLMAMELRNRMQTALQIGIPIAELLEGPSLQQLATRVAVALEAREGAAAATVTAPAGAAPEQEWEEGLL